MISLRTSNKSEVYFKIRFLRSLTCLNLDRTVISPILIDLLSSEHSKTSLGHDSFLQLIEISIDFERSKRVGRVENVCSDMTSFPGARCSMASAGFETRTEREKNIYIYIYIISTTRHTHRWLFRVCLGM